MAAIAAWLAGLVASLIPVVAGFIGKKFAMASVYIGVFLVLGATCLLGFLVFCLVLARLFRLLSRAFLPCSRLTLRSVYPPSSPLTR